MDKQGLMMRLYLSIDAVSKEMKDSGLHYWVEDFKLLLLIGIWENNNFFARRYDTNILSCFEKSSNDKKTKKIAERPLPAF